MWAQVAVYRKSYKQRVDKTRIYILASQLWFCCDTLCEWTFLRLSAVVLSTVVERMGQRQRDLWKWAIRSVRKLIADRKLWALLGQRLKESAALFSHLERKRGALTYKR